MSATLDPDPAATRPPPPLRSGVDTLLTVLGVAVVGFGIYLMVARQLYLSGPLLVGIGMTMIPGRWPGVVGGIVLIGAGGYQCYVFKTVTLLGGVLIVFGIVAILERLRRH